MIDLSRILKELEERINYLTIYLKQKARVESIKRHHLLLFVEVTSGGINFGLCVRLIISGHMSVGRDRGPAAPEDKLNMLPTSKLDTTLYS